MKKLFVVAALVLAGVMAWRVMHNLSSDAISMALGMFFGVVAGIPTALLMLSSNRRGGHPSGRERGPYRHSPQHHSPHHMMPSSTAHPQHPPVIIVTGTQGALPPPSQATPFPYGEDANWPAPYAHHAQPSGRTFRIIGEPEHWDEA